MTTAHAQEVPRPFTPPSVLQGSPLPGIVQPEQPTLAPGLPRPARPTAPESVTGGATHAISNVVINGATAFPQSQIAALTQGLTGPSVPEAQIEASRAAIVDLYRSQGYAFTTVQATVQRNEVRFQVIEGYVADVKLDGDIGPAGTQVLRFLRHLVGQTPLNTAELERWLLLAQDIPGLTVKSVLNPSEGDPGALTLVAQVSRRPFTGYISADNRAFDLIGPKQGLGVFNANSFTEYGEQTQLSLYGALNGANFFGQVSEELFVGGSGLKFRLYGGGGRSSPRGVLQQIGYTGRTDIFGGSFAYPVIRSRAQSLVMSLAFDALENNTQNNLNQFGTPQRSSFDSLRVFRLGEDYAMLDTWLGADRTGINSFSAKLSQGVSALGASSNNDTWTPPPRLGETITFTKISGETSRTQTLFRPFADASVALAGRVGWQYSAVLLPPAEKFYLGGPQFNRGYYYGQVSGDSAVTAAVELQLNARLPTPKPIPFEVQSQFYLFYDWGQAWQNTSLEADVVLRSWGGGVRFFLSSATEIDFEGVYRQNRYPNGGQGTGISPLSSAAFYWQLLQRF
ncbi:MAG: ShlB/FhaC/HecB family hemolysin secretion/activation protein [Acetobacteraceae bacterium]|nr:ShlB/FhaC/HecB family hemolysin secretion/activation protein [Pseudomonadota bacterium]